MKRFESGGEGAVVNSASGTPSPWSSDIPCAMWRPNPALVEDFDAVVPFRHRTTDAGNAILSFALQQPVVRLTVMTTGNSGF